MLSLQIVYPVSFNPFRKALTGLPVCIMYLDSSLRDSLREVHLNSVVSFLKHSELLKPVLVWGSASRLWKLWDLRSWPPPLCEEELRLQRR